MGEAWTSPKITFLNQKEEEWSSPLQDSILGKACGDCNTDEQIIQNLISALKILNLCTNLSRHTTSIGIQILLNKFIQEITNSKYSFIIPILVTNEEGIIQVIGEKVLNKEIRFSITTKDIINASQNCFKFFISSLNRDFREVIKMLTGNENILFYDIKELNKNTKSILTEMIPLDVISLESSVTGLTNCSTFFDDLETLPQSDSDGHMEISFFIGIAGDESCRVYYRYCIYETLRFTIGHLLTAIQLEEVRRIQNQCKKLFQISRNFIGEMDGKLIQFKYMPERYYTIKLDTLKSACISNHYYYESDDFNTLLEGILTTAQELTSAEYCSLFLLEKNTRELVSIDRSKNNKIRVQKSIGAAGYVAETGKLLNITNAYTHPLFDKNIDEQTGFKNRNILCFPIYDQNTVIGVVQLCNKLNGYHFEKRDEEIAKVFSIYTGIAIKHIIFQKTVQRAEARHKASQGLILYHKKISEVDVQELIVLLKNINNKKIPHLNSFTFPTRTLNHKEIFQASLQMFTDLDFIKKFKIHPVKLARFLLIIQKGYRDTVPYHNWMHAFTVAHFAYALLMNCKLVERGILSELEALSFLISTFCHDLDHRATTNAYHMESKDNLARLYNNQDSVNERHHLSQTIYILTNENSRILDGLTTEEFKIIITTIKKFILATDLAHHFHILKQLSHLSKDNCTENKYMAMSLLITCCDLSDQIKEWPNTQQVSDLMYLEFFAQGDLEKQMGIIPQKMMDRQRAVIPELEIEFIIDVVLPTFEILEHILPETKYLLEIIKDNLEHWEKLNTNRKIK